MAKKKKSEFEPEPNMYLETIIQYEMNDLEAKAMHIVVLWLERSRKVFPEYRHSTMGKGDPRRSLIFKICFKLVRETQGVLADEEYPLYVRAQLDVLKHINSQNGRALIDPNCLVGEKAWKRWKLWKRRYDLIKNRRDTTGTSTPQGVIKALDGLEKTKEFFTKALGECSTAKYREAYLNNNLFRWYNLGKISPYYLAMSSYLKSVLKENDYQKLNFDIGVYIPCIDESVKQRFVELFPGEPLALEEKGDETP